MGFNLNRRFKPIILDSPKLSEKQLKETIQDGKSLVSVVDVPFDSVHLPDYDAFPLEAQLASGVPLQRINPTILDDTNNSHVDEIVNNIISETSQPENNND